MTGLDKIVKQIQDEARQRADGALEKAKAEAAALEELAQKETAANRALIRAQSENAVKNQLAAAQSAAELAKRRAILEAKQEIIGGVIQDVQKEIHALPDSAYFDLILKMVKKYSLAQSGEILFSKKDAARLPAGFAEKLAAAANGPLAVSEQTRPIDGGFVLSYGGIEENCSIDALFYAARERLQDKVSELLFS